MEQLPFINIHTHSPARPGEWVIQNIHKDFSSLPHSPFSAGLHPWYINAQTWQQQFNDLEKICADKNMAAIGECGLDRVCATGYKLQQQVFTAQINLANRVKKPLILHCVRAHEDVMHLLEAQLNSMPVIFHGFNKGLLLAKRIIDKGYYLSFGKALQRPHMQEIFTHIPLDNIFLETDDAGVEIKVLYDIAAVLRHISAEELNLQLQQNLQSVFNIRI